MRAFDSVRKAWSSPWGVRARRVAYWGTLAVLIVLVVRRYVPDYDLPDLGPAPAFAYATLDGGEIELADVAGQVVVLNVWATWCAPCVIETPGFVDLQAELAGDVQFLGLSVDDNPEAVQRFVERYNVDYPILVGANRAGPPPSAAVLPTTYVIDRQGRVRLRHEGILLEPALRPVLRALRREGS
ncbi:MAG: TlpA disulfide reductase family protein [Bacteroidota bacterium]